LRMPELEDAAGGKQGYGSTLTHGTQVLFAGNIAKGIRKYKDAENPIPKTPVKNVKEGKTEMISFDLEDSEQGMKDDFAEIMAELRAYRIDKVRPATAPAASPMYIADKSIHNLVPDSQHDQDLGLDLSSPPRARSADRHSSKKELSSAFSTPALHSIERHSSPGKDFTESFSNFGETRALGPEVSIDIDKERQELGLTKPRRRMRKLGQKMSKSTGILPPMSAAVPESSDSSIGEIVKASRWSEDSVPEHHPSIKIEDQWSESGLHSKVSSITNTSSQKKVLGTAISMADKEIINLLKMKPKNVPEFKTRNGFKRFFEGMDQARIINLLQEAYQDIDEIKRNEKIQSRLDILLQK